MLQQTTEPLSIYVPFLAKITFYGIIRENDVFYDILLVLIFSFDIFVLYFYYYYYIIYCLILIERGSLRVNKL